MAVPPSESFIGFEVGLAETPTARLMNLDSAKHVFMKFDSELASRTKAELYWMAEDFANRLREEFKRHDTTGQWNDPSQWKPGYIHTIDTIEVQSTGPWSEMVTMGGAATFVEYGSREHPISPVESDHLIWMDEGGMWHFRDAVWHPGYKGDDFVGRAMSRMDFDGALKRIFSESYQSLFVSAKSRTGEVYTTPEWYSSFTQASSSSFSEY